jgi:hypothetical protein
MSSLHKYANNDPNSNLHWHRVDLDGAPYRARGKQLPLLREEEREGRVVTVHDAKNGTFCTHDPEQNAKYLYILDRIYNRWFVMLYVRRWRKQNKMYVYIEWLERYVEDRQTTG